MTCDFAKIHQRILTKEDFAHMTLNNFTARTNVPEVKYPAGTYIQKDERIRMMEYKWSAVLNNDMGYCTKMCSTMPPPFPHEGPLTFNKTVFQESDIWWLNHGSGAPHENIRMEEYVKRYYPEGQMPLHFRYSVPVTVQPAAVPVAPPTARPGDPRYPAAGLRVPHAWGGPPIAHPPPAPMLPEDPTPSVTLPAPKAAPTAVRGPTPKPKAKATAAMRRRIAEQAKATPLAAVPEDAVEVSAAPTRAPRPRGISRRAQVEARSDQVIADEEFEYQRELHFTKILKVLQDRINDSLAKGYDLNEAYDEASDTAQGTPRFQKPDTYIDRDWMWIKSIVQRRQSLDQPMETWQQALDNAIRKNKEKKAELLRARAHTAERPPLDPALEEHNPLYVPLEREPGSEPSYMSRASRGLFSDMEPEEENKTFEDFRALARDGGGL